MAITGFLKEIGRGAAGARSLSRSQAHALMADVLDDRVEGVELGAFVMAMRMKGETLDEICGFLDAVHERTLVMRSERPVVVIPSYNGARRLPNLTALLAMELAHAGQPVLVHGPLSDPARVTTAEVMHDLGLPCARHEEEVHSAWARREPAFIATATLCPPLQRLLDVRVRVGLRNAGHTVAKMLHPFGTTRVLRLVNFTHPEFGKLMTAWAQREGADAMLLRGTEGEAVADPRRRPRIDTYTLGVPCPAASLAAQEGPLSELPLLPAGRDAATTALYIQSVLGAERPAPGPLMQQVAAVLAAVGALQCPPAALSA